MNTITLHALDTKSILLKGLGYNQKLEPISVDRLPGSVLITSESCKASIRIYCIFDEYERSWVFAIAPKTEYNKENFMDYMTDQKWDTKGHISLSISHLPDDAVLELEGEFRND